jgi:hypothetical protein
MVALCLGFACCCSIRKVVCQDFCKMYQTSDGFREFVDGSRAKLIQDLREGKLVLESLPEPDKSAA